jgi:hypothetical protein
MIDIDDAEPAPLGAGEHDEVGVLLREPGTADATMERW